MMEALCSFLFSARCKTRVGEMQTFPGVRLSTPAVARRPVVELGTGSDPRALPEMSS